MAGEGSKVTTGAHPTVGTFASCPPSPWGRERRLGRSMGAVVTGLSVEDPVAVDGPWGCGRCARCRVGMENYCERQLELGAAGGGLGYDGGMDPLMLVPEARWLVPLGDLDPVEAAPLTDAGLTPYHAIARSLDLLGPEVSVATTYWGSIPELMQVISLATEGHIRAHVQRYELADAMSAYNAMTDGTLDGRAVIVPT
jgi:alcohol dehydrogenase, propanol-preferring